jgi:hypothetical protein
MIPPPISLAVFILVSLATQKKTPPRHDVIYLVPRDEDVVAGTDVKDWVNPIDVRLIKR